MPQIQIENGQARFKRRKLLTIYGKAKYDSANSYNMSRNALARFYTRCANGGAAWVVFETFVFRQNPIKTCEYYLQLVYNSLIAYGWSSLHYSKYPTSRQQFEGLKRYVVWAKTIEVQVHADGGPVHNVPREYHSMTVIWLKFDIWLEHLKNSLYAGFPLLLSALPKDHPSVKIYYRQQIELLGSSGIFTIQDEKNHAEIRIPWKLEFSGDLKIRNDLCNEAMTAGSTYGVPQAVKLDTTTENYPITGKYSISIYIVI